MKQYIFFPTWNDHWYDISIKLKEEKIAEPFLWIGDPKHFQRAKIEFGEEVVKDRDFLINKGKQQYNKVESIPSVRGKILDRDGSLLAISVESESIYAQQTLQNIG